MVTAIDNCSSPDLIQLSLNAYTVANSCGYTFVREWTAIDGMRQYYSGNSNS